MENIIDITEIVNNAATDFKAKITARDNAPKLWTPNQEMFRVYVGDAYAQISVKESRPRGYYQSHRYCKGERFATGWVKAVGMSIEAAMILANQFASDIAWQFEGLGCSVEMVASKF